jgi:mannosyltransferase
VSRRGRFLAMVLLTGIAFGLRVQGLVFQSLWRDEIDSLRFASQPLVMLFKGLGSPGHNGPLYYLLLRPWLEVAGRSEFSLRFFSAAAGVLAVPLLWRVALELEPRRPAVALVGALLVATSPYLVWYSQEARMYAAVVCLVLLSMYCLLVAARKGGWLRWLGYALVTGTAFYVHLLAVLIVAAQMAMLMVLRRRFGQEARRSFSLSLAGLALFYVPFLVWQLPTLARSVPSSYSFVPLPLMFGSLLSSYTSGVLERSAAWSLMPLVALAAAGAMAPRLDGRLSVFAAAGIWLLVPVLELFLITLHYPLFTARYLVFVVPALLLLVAMGVESLAWRSRWLAALLLASLLAANLSSVWLQARTPLKADFRSATLYVTARMSPGDGVVFQIPYGRYSFEYYLEHSRVSPPAEVTSGRQQLFLPLVFVPGPSTYWIDGLYTNGGVSPREVDQQMAALIGERRVVWLVESEAAMWDERGLVRGWLDTHASLTGRVDFVRVSVRRYSLH